MKNCSFILGTARELPLNISRLILELTQPSVLWVWGEWGSFLGVKQLVVRGKMCGIMVYFIPPHVFMALCLIK